MEREAARRHRELLARENDRAAWAERQRAEHEVGVFANQIEFLTSMHKDCGPEWDWEAVSTREPPSPPQPQHDFENQVRALAARTLPAAPQLRRDNEERARAVLQEYRPSMLDRLFGSDKKRLAELEYAVSVAQAADARALEAEQAAHAKLVARYERDLADAQRKDSDALLAAQADYAEHLAQMNWERQVAIGVLRSDSSAYRSVLEHLAPFEELIESGMIVSVVDLRADVVVLSCIVKDESIMPREKKELSAAGKLTTKAIAAGTYWATYQDYVCGCALRAAREVFALLPLPRVVVNVALAGIDTATGHPADITILAVSIPREVAARLRYESLDPSDSLVNFDYRMKFKKSSGFEPVEPMSADESFIDTRARRR